MTLCFVRSQLMQLRILPDDIIVSGTDGLFDNVFAEEVASLVTFARKRGDSPALAATVLASYTQMKAAETTHMSPFAYAAQVPDLSALVLLNVMCLTNKLVPVSTACFASMSLTSQASCGTTGGANEVLAVCRHTAFRTGEASRTTSRCSSAT